MRGGFTWLNVTGCPRSGTTALGSGLNRSSSIAILHEHNPKDFFAAIDLLFKNERFHGALGSIDHHSEAILLRDRDLIGVIKSVFSLAFAKSPQVVGTKFPGLQRWEKADYPGELGFREINIVRNPIDVVNSYVVKGDGTLSDDPERAFCDWLNSFNYAISRYGDPDFFLVIYEGFHFNRNVAIAESIAEFLGVDADFDLANMGSSGGEPEPKFLSSPTGDFVFECISKLFDMYRWEEDVASKIRGGHLVGYLLRKGEAIDLTSDGNSWKYIYDGFYPAERDGSWTRGGCSTLCFTPEVEFLGQIHVVMNVSWALVVDDIGPEFCVYLDDFFVGKVSLPLRESNGFSNLIVFVCNDFRQISKSITLKIDIRNPRNPCHLGISGDDRSLGVMIRSIAISFS